VSLHLHLDPFAGIAGDMFIGAMIDLGVDLDAIRRPLADLPTSPPYTLSADETRRHTIRAIDFRVHLQSRPHAPDAPGAAEPAPRGNTPDPALEPGHHEGNPDAPRPSHTHAHDHDHAHDHSHGQAHDHRHVHPGDILALIDRLDLAPRGKERARAIVNRLAEAEAAVHGIPVEKVHFHEVGAVDSIVDMLGAAICLETLDVATVSCGPLPIGRGFVRCDHGTMPLPAPATAAVMERRGIPQFGVDRTGETVTPTGAALVAALADAFGPLPPMSVKAIGYGAGDRDDPDLPNLLRAYLGRRIT